MFSYLRTVRHLTTLGGLAGLLFITPLATPGQAPGSSRGLASGEGNHMIQGRVHLPSGQALEKPAKVRLESISNFSNLSTVTDQDGAFHFPSLPAGGYTIVVDAGNEFEIAREPVNIDREASPGGRTIQVAIVLRYRVDSSNPAFANVPANALSAYQKGTAAAKKGDTKQAIEYLSKAVAIYPGFAIGLSELGVLYLKAGQMSKAGETYEALIKLKPSDSVAHLNLGIARFNEKKFEDAEKHLQEALKLNQSGPTAYYYLGLTFLSVKRYDEAEKQLELAISNGGENLALAHKYLGGLYMSFKKNSQAADELEKYLKLDPKAPDADRIKGTIKDLRNKP